MRHPTSPSEYKAYLQRKNEEQARLLGKIGELQHKNAAIKVERNRLRVALQDIADASGFDNIGNWAQNKAKEALAKEAQP